MSEDETRPEDQAHPDAPGLTPAFIRACQARVRRWDAAVQMERVRDDTGTYWWLTREGIAATTRGFFVDATRTEWGKAEAESE